MIQKNSILPIIVISQFCCTSLWFASNGVMTNLVETFQLNNNAIGALTSIIQLGFILGTLVFAILTIADRFSPSKVFFLCAILGAVFNTGMIWNQNTFSTLLVIRFLTGFCLAGIYPVGMKIAADYFNKGLGTSLGYLVGALVLGTAFPHLLKSIMDPSMWKIVILATSVIAVIGGLLMIALVPDGPFRKPAQRLNFRSFYLVFKPKAFRAAAFGYFGHMWELYAFWAFVPVLLETYKERHLGLTFNTPLMSFIIIGLGGFSCILGGYLSKRFGEKRIATIALTSSGICCFASPLFLIFAPTTLFILFLVFWGLVVIADSPLFSTLVAHNASPELKATALTIVNCIGFAITIASILLLTILNEKFNSNSVYLVLAVGPVLGLWALKRS